MRDRAKRYYDAAPEKFRQRSNAWQRTHPEIARRADRYHHLSRTYGITEAQYDTMLAEQGGTCAICKRPEVSKWRRKGEPEERRMAIDHDHTTRQVRGLLCNRCNMGIARFDDDPERLRTAADYLMAHALAFGFA